MIIDVSIYKRNILEWNAKQQENKRKYTLYRPVLQSFI